MCFFMAASWSATVASWSHGNGNNATAKMEGSKEGRTSTTCLCCDFGLGGGLPLPTGQQPALDATNRDRPRAHFLSSTSPAFYTSGLGPGLGCGAVSGACAHGCNAPLVLRLVGGWILDSRVAWAKQPCPAFAHPPSLHHVSADLSEAEAPSPCAGRESADDGSSMNG